MNLDDRSSPIHPPPLAHERIVSLICGINELSMPRGRRTSPPPSPFQGCFLNPQTWLLIRFAQIWRSNGSSATRAGRLFSRGSGNINGGERGLPRSGCEARRRCGLAGETSRLTDSRMVTHLRMKLHSGELLGNQKETFALTRVAMDL